MENRAFGFRVAKGREGWEDFLMEVVDFLGEKEFSEAVTGLSLATDGCG
jgi:hypothetical protein